MNKMELANKIYNAMVNYESIEIEGVLFQNYLDYEMEIYIDGIYLGQYTSYYNEEADTVKLVYMTNGEETEFNNLDELKNTVELLNLARSIREF